MCELVVFDGHFPSTTAYGMQKRETGIKQLNDIKGTSSTEIPVASDWLRSKNFRGLRFAIHEIIQNVCSAMKSCLQNYDHLFPLIQPCSQPFYSCLLSDLAFEWQRG